MKTPEEIKAALRYLSITDIGEKLKLADDVAYAYQEEAVADALAYIQQLEAALPQWISVDERLPEDNVTVLVCQRNVRNGSCIMALSSRSTFSSAVGNKSAIEPRSLSVRNLRPQIPRVP